MDNTQKTVKETLSTMESYSGRKRLRRWLIVAAGLIVVGLGFKFFRTNSPENGVHFQTQSVTRGDLVITVTATGNLEATNQVEVGSELSGIITKLSADFNDIVESNQPLAYLDDTKYKATVAKSKAEVASAKANYKESVATHKADQQTLKRYQRTRELTKGKLPSMEEMEQAEAELVRSAAMVEAAQATIAKAEAALKSDEADLKKTVIYSPINGIVLSRNVEPGQTVAASLEAPVLYTLAEDLRHMELQVDVDEADVGLVREGQTATFTVDAYPERKFTARIIQVRYGAETTDGVVTYKTVLQVENPDLLLRPGMTATADIIVQKIEDTLLVSNTALRFKPPLPETGDSSKRGLVDSLLPGPPRRWSEKKNGNNAMDAKEMSSRVWIFKDNIPVPVSVEKIATNGVKTAIQSRDLTQDMEVIVSAVTSSN